MRVAVYTTADDLQWLRGVHLGGLAVVPFAAALLYGNEDWPERIELYPGDDCTARPVTTIRLDDSGRAYVAAVGEPAS